MKFRPCIDIHNGKVKQIVGGSLKDEGDAAKENFVAEQDAAFYADFYKKDHIKGGHVILLNPASSSYYEETKRQALLALGRYPGGLQIGGGINPENACEFLDAGASHVIVTSYVFKDGRIHMERLEKLVQTVGKEHLVLDLSCKKKSVHDERYYVVTDRWQNYTEVALEGKVLDCLWDYCDEFLIHAADVEGKGAGIEQPLVSLLGSWGKCPVTYAGGVGSYQDLELLRKLGENHVDVTVGSALDLFGGHMSYQKILELCDK